MHNTGKNISGACNTPEIEGQAEAEFRYAVVDEHNDVICIRNDASECERWVAGIILGRNLPQRGAHIADIEASFEDDRRAS